MSDLGNKNPYDVCVVGGGFMGAAVALGLARSGAKVLMLDQISKIHKASKANFGLVWSQSKGAGHRSYSRFSEKAVLAFDRFVEALEEESGIDVELRLGAGLILCLGEKELAERRRMVEVMHREAAASGESHPSCMLDRSDVQDLIGKTLLGEEVSGASFSPIDGDVNPLLLLKAMRKRFLQKGGTFRHGCRVQGVTRTKTHYALKTSCADIAVPKLVMAAGLGNLSLMAMLGKKIPLKPQRGQLLVTERLQPFLPVPLSGIRQTVGGSVMIGYTQENTGFDVDTTVSAASALAQNGVRTFPGLRRARVVRSWAALRVLTEDDLPIYDEIAGYPDAYVLATHSCVTLAPLHAALLPPWILDGHRPEEIKHYTLERFHV